MSHDLNEFSHILYEAKMYVLTYRFTADDRLFTNLVRATHTVHLRILNYFFGASKEGRNLALFRVRQGQGPCKADSRGPLR